MSLHNVCNSINRLDGIVSRIWRTLNKQVVVSATLTLIIYDPDTNIVDNIVTKNVTVVISTDNNCLIRMISSDMLMAENLSTTGDLSMIGSISLNTPSFPKVISLDDSKVGTISKKLSSVGIGDNIGNLILDANNILDGNILPTMEAMKVSSNNQSQSMADNIQLALAVSNNLTNALMFYTGSPIQAIFGQIGLGLNLGIASVNVEFSIPMIF